jgi:hypothetical protein
MEAAEHWLRFDLLAIWIRLSSELGMSKSIAQEADRGCISKSPRDYPSGASDLLENSETSQVLKAWSSSK